MFKRKDGLWQETITIDGKRHYYYGKTKAELLKKIKYQQNRIRNGPRFAEIAEQWDAEHEQMVSYNAHVAYRTAHRLACEHFGNEYIKTITASDISAYIAQYAQMRYKKRTVQMHLTYLCLVFDYAQRHGILADNPARLVKLPKNLETSKRSLPESDDVALIKASVDLPFGLFYYLMLYTGLRRGEALALRYEDIDRDKRTISVRRSLYWDPNQPVLKDTKTSAGERTVILLDALAAKLPNGKGYVFGGTQPLTQTVYRKKLREYQTMSGVRCTPHQLRHLYATMLYEAGVDDAVATELLGHSSITVTRDIYTHIRQSKLDHAAELLNKVSI